jgi:hypothetical protein
MKLGMVCGYGSILDDNLKEYLCGVIDYCSKEKIEGLILSGGITNTSSDVSEAEVMHDFIRQSNSSIQIFMEDKALTTLHNFLYSKKIIEQTPILVDELTIFCDQARSLKVYCLSLIIFGDKKVNIKTLSRQEPLWVYFLQVPSTINHVLGAIIPSMEKRILVNKQQWIKKYR